MSDHIAYHADLEQGTDEWLAARRGILTASEMKYVLTPTLKIANNDKTRAHVWEIASQRISGHIEPHYVSDDMLRGHEDEMWARMAYVEHCEKVQDVGFVTNNRWGFTIGFSPDGLVGDDGLIEIKSRRQKYQIQTIVENVSEDTIPSDFMLQCQTGLLVTERKWLDFISYSNGLHMPVIRVLPIPEVQEAIVKAAEHFEAEVSDRIAAYNTALKTGARLFPTERRATEQEMIL